MHIYLHNCSPNSQFYFDFKIAQNGLLLIMYWCLENFKDIASVVYPVGVTTNCEQFLRYYHVQLTQTCLELLLLLLLTNDVCFKFIAFWINYILHDLWNYKLKHYINLTKLLFGLSVTTYTSCTDGLAEIILELTSHMLNKQWAHVFKQ